MSDKQLKKDVEEIFGGSELAIPPDKLKEIENMGMSKVDPADIRPPQIILVQKSSDFELLQDKNGKKPEVGDYFHTGKREIYKDFQCHFLFASKSTYIDRRKEDQPEKDQYTALGAMKDLSLFAMWFRGTAVYALSSLFTASQANHAPMFAFEVTMETKKLEGDKGSWYVPVCRVGQIVQDMVMFDELYTLAKRFDNKPDETATNLTQEGDGE